MNTREKSIKAANTYILRDAVVASPAEYPQLCRIFDEIKKRNPCGKKLTLMVGNAYSGGLAIWHSKRSGTILLDRKEISTIDEKEIRFLIGHELGHHLHWRDLDSKPKTSKPDKQMPPQPLLSLCCSIYDQINADLVGVEQCRSAFISGSYLSDGDSEMEYLYDNPLEPLPEKFYDDFELAIRIKALGLLANSEYYYELIGSELFGHGKWAISTEEYFEKMDHLFDPYMDFTDEDGRTLGAFIGASMFIAGCKVGDVLWHRELDRLGDFGDPVELLSYASKDQAYDGILSVSDRLRNIRHPLKHLAWNAVWDLTYRESEDTDEAEKFDNFIDYIAGRDKTAA